MSSNVHVGTETIFWHWPSGPMWTGSGQRDFVKTVQMPAGWFNGGPPEVIAALSGLDASSDTNVRVSVTVENVTKTSFDVKVSTWADTRLAMAAVTWVAVRN